MSDYLGPNQTRVLDSEDRNFESVIYQKRKPPLSCEANLEEDLSSERDRRTINYLIPSGWAIVGQPKENVLENTCSVGDVLMSSSFARNSFKLIATDRGLNVNMNVAWVNGWRFLVQGTNSSDNNNIIILPDPPEVGTRVDFVFLEVWRKLIGTTDVIYKYGNVLYGGTNWPNDLVDPFVGIETSLRIQLQYRIRVEEVNIEAYPDGFDPNEVFVQGPLAQPNSTCSHAYFSSVPGDVGLWIAGSGDSVAQETLGTVDGHTYAIPMFAIRRRNSAKYSPDAHANGAYRSLADYNNGLASDRPDNLYNDWIVKDDILDMRHRVVQGENYKEICEDAFKKAINGKIRGKMTKSTLGEDHFGINMVQVDAVSNVDHPGSTRIGTGDGLRRVFSNAETDQSDSIAVRTVQEKIIGTPNLAWAAGDRVQVSLSAYPSGSQITSLQEIYTGDGTVTIPTDVSSSIIPTNNLILEIPVGSSLISTTHPLKIDSVIRFPSGPYGLTQVPEMFLETRKEDASTSYAMPDISIRVRDAGPVSTTDGTKFHMLQNHGANSTEQYDFGHQMVYHAVGNGTQTITIPRVYNGYTILGVVSAKVSGTYRNVSVQRSASTYTINLGSPSVTVGTDIEVVLYTAGKFFSGNKQGRAILDCFEMTEFQPDETATGSLTTFHVDTTNKAVVALSSYINNNGIGYAYVNGVMRVLDTNNSGFPLDSTKSRITIQFPGTSIPLSGSIIEVPVLVKSSITNAEGYSFFYDTVPYQGLLDSSSTGVVENVGPSITTTAGSGTFTDYTYSEGKAFFTDSTVLRGENASWASNVKPGYVIRANVEPEKEYVIASIYDQTTMFLNFEPDHSSGVGGDFYTIIAKDQPFFNHPDVIDRLPTLNSDNDASGRNEPVSFAGNDAFPVLETRIISRLQDIADMPANSIWVGENVADRGRSTISLPEEFAPLGLGNLGLSFEKLDMTGGYQKTFQSYIFNKDNSGRLYLMVIGTETGNESASRKFNESSDNDSVDIFELPGRPIVMKRIY